MSRFATGITVVAVEVRGEVFGMTANAFMAASLVPPLCTVSISRAARMHARLGRGEVFGVSFLREDQRHLSDHFAARRIPGVQLEFRRLCGAPVLARAIAVVAAEVVDVYECGDHTFFVGKTVALEEAAGRPLLFYRGRYARLDCIHGAAEAEPPAFW